MDELFKLAYTMKKKHYAKGSVILNQGDRVDSVAIVKKGSVKISHKMIKQRKKKAQLRGGKRGSIQQLNQNFSESTEISVDIAEISSHDLIGIVEATTSKKTRNVALAQSHVELFFVQTTSFIALLQQEKKTLKQLEKLGKRSNY
jgi:CRP-like cAMP-binding protein